MVLVLWCYAFVLIALSDEQRQNQGRGLVDRKLVKAPSNFIAGRPKVDFLFWFFGYFRCGVLLFMVVLVTYNYKNVWEIAVHMAVAGDSVFLCCPFPHEMSWVRSWT